MNYVSWKSRSAMQSNRSITQDDREFRRSVEERPGDIYATKMLKSSSQRSLKSMNGTVKRDDSDSAPYEDVSSKWFPNKLSGR